MSRTGVGALAVVFFFFLVQNTLGLVFSEYAPALALAAVVYYGLTRGPSFGFFLGAAAGVFFEIFSVGRIGHEMIALGLCGLAAGYTATAFFRENLLARVVLPAALVYGEALFRLAMDGGVREMGSVFGILQDAFVWPTILSTAIFSPFLFRLLGRKASPGGYFRG
ncbi:MAG: hypothetical protein HYT89_06705 [Candidatus Omnitrophica bacterium]|nr:hypothetical protein [Candidatus Omnitrophota bacterium]